MRALPVLSALLLALGGCGGQAGDTPREPPLVAAAAAKPARFVERIDAVGTALANEQVTLAAPVTERITRLNFSDGGYVRAGQVIAELARGQEAATLADAKARQTEAQQQLRRLEELRRRGFATRSAVDSQTALASSAAAQAQEAQATIGDRVVRAPFSGFVSLRMISTGAVVAAGTEIATISDTSRIKLDFAVPETLLSTLAEGQAIQAVAAAFPGQPFNGTIATIDAVVNAQSRAVTVRAILPNRDGRLKPGMLLTVTIEAQPREALSVPELAVVGDGEQNFVFVIGADNVAKRVKVRTGGRQNGVVEILEGLKPGQRVVTEGVVKISDGMKVRLAGAPR